MCGQITPHTWSGQTASDRIIQLLIKPRLPMVVNNGISQISPPTPRCTIKPQVRVMDAFPHPTDTVAYTVRIFNVDRLGRFPRVLIEIGVNFVNICDQAFASLFHLLEASLKGGG